MFSKISKALFTTLGLTLTFSAISLGNEYKPGETLICIDPGHQGKGNREMEEIAPGSSKKKVKVADGTAGVATRKNEYELTLEVGLKLKDAFKRKGYKVLMTRETHNVNISNKERSLMTNKASCDAYIK